MFVIDVFLTVFPQIFDNELMLYQTAISGQHKLLIELRSMLISQI